jgi:outer membrane receptor for ferrienterochelin and colicin
LTGGEHAGGSVDLDAELSWNYELGVRANPRDGLSYEATLFRMDFENQIVPASSEMPLDRNIHKEIGEVVQEIIGLRYELDNYKNDRDWAMVKKIRLEIARLEAMLSETY